MEISQALSDECRGNSTVTSEAFAHSGEFIGDFLASWNAIELPNSGAFTDPSLFSVGRGNPDSGLLSLVDDSQRPLGFESVDVFVEDGCFAEGIHNNQVILSENQLGSNPNQKSYSNDQETDDEVASARELFNWIENHLGQVEQSEQDGNGCPCEVSLGSEDMVFIHALIIAGNSAVR